MELAKKGKSMKSSELFKVLLACVCVAGCEKAPEPRSSIDVRAGVSLADFVGKWTGETTDKPGEGGTSDTMELYVEEISKSRLEVFVLGTFAHEGNQKVEKIHLVDNKIGFRMSAMDGKTLVWLGLHPTEENKLIGESFALEPTCDGRTIELTREKE
jgi:hypothetical protein